MEDIRTEPPEAWVDFAERVGAMAREEGLLGIIIAGFSPAGENGMELHLSMMNSSALCEHDKQGMRLKVIEKLAIKSFDATMAQGHGHDDSDGENGELQ